MFVVLIDALQTEVIGSKYTELIVYVWTEKPWRSLAPTFGSLITKFLNFDIILNIYAYLFF
jgi:hypothetical protein